MIPENHKLIIRDTFAFTSTKDPLKKFGFYDLKKHPVS
jgi:hypothetical protein